MPRKPKPPHPELIVQGLSTANAPTATHLEPDDFGEGMIVVHEVANAKPMAKPITNWRKHLKEEKLKHEREIARRYVEQRDRAHKLLFEKREQVLAHNQHKLTDKLVLTMHKPKPKWRRL